MTNPTEQRCDHNENEGFHDCYILGIFADDRTEHKGEIHIQCDVCGARLVMTLHGLYRMSVQDFWEGNDIHDIIQYTWPDMPIEWLEDLLHTKNPPEANLNEIRDEGMVLLHVTASYGCEVLALCKSVTIQGPASD